jgi:hypothetical protein
MEGSEGDCRVCGRLEKQDSVLDENRSFKLYLSFLLLPHEDGLFGNSFLIRLQTSPQRQGMIVSFHTHEKRRLKGALPRLLVSQRTDFLAGASLSSA